MSSLNPCFTVGFQIGETLKTHLDLKRAERDRRIVELLAEVGIPDPEAPRPRLSPPAFGRHEPAGHDRDGACLPAKLLIADEPTTALDVTIQAQILDLLMRERRDNGMGLVLITHDMGVVAETADRVIVQYAGQRWRRTARGRSLPIRIIPIPPRFWRRCRSGRTDGGCQPSRASCPGRSTARTAACSRRAAPLFSTPAMIPSRRRLSPRFGRARCLTPLVAEFRARSNARRGSMNAVLEARGLTRDYSVSRGAFRSHATIKALNNVPFSLRAGSTLAVVGESGSGKSTLARLLTLIENPTAGSLLIDGEDVAHASAETRSAPKAGNPDRVPEPLWVAQSAPDNRQGARGAAARQHEPRAPPSARPRLCRSWPRSA